MQGELYGPEVAALIQWAAYTCMRPSETFAARHGLLNGDTYDLRRQFNSMLGEETVPSTTRLAWSTFPNRRNAPSATSRGPSAMT
jgi:hypothetical protein